MKRHTIALLLHPFKNRLMPRPELKDAIDNFVQNLISLAFDFPHLRFNVVLPGYILESINTLLLSNLRDLQKKGTLEWLLTGYTEPFLSISPVDLTIDNVNHGMQIFSDLTGEMPSGILPPFSNWEPSFINSLCRSGLNYTVLSRELLSNFSRSLCGYWMVEHAGNSMALIATHIIHSTIAPADFKDWLEKVFSQDNSESSKFLAIQYMLPLHNYNESDPFRWLRFAAEEIDNHILNYQPVRISDYLHSTQPLGLQFIPSSLYTGIEEPAGIHFLNRLYSHDQIGIMQRKLIETWDQISSITDQKIALPLKKQLYSVQDINRFLPGKESGFECLSDRLWSYSKLIEIEKTLHLKNDIKGGQIRITDFIKNGSKSIILSNKSLKLYVDHVNGGQIFEFDYRDRLINLCAAYNPLPHQPPNIIAPGKSRTWFIDHILPEDCKGWDFINGNGKDLGNFLSGQFEYKVRKASSGVKVILSRQGSFLRADRFCPISIEKVFGLEQDGSILSFVYQLSNPSLMAYSFRFATQLTLSLPGLSTGQVRLVHGSETIENLGLEYTRLESKTRWSIEDKTGGLKLLFQTQKPIDIWLLPTSLHQGSADPSTGLGIVLSTVVSLDPSSKWKMIGKLTCKKLRKKGTMEDAF